MRQPSATNIAVVPNPCVRNCCLDAQDICLGCGRQLQEILAWHRLDEAARQQILERIANRSAQR